MPECEKCGKPIFWVIMAETGRNVPLDKNPVLFVQVEGKTGRAIHGYTPHWKTCPVRQKEPSEPI